MLVLENVKKAFDDRSGGTERVRAIDDVSLEVHEGDFVTILGPSGCGKTTTLRSVAGLERPDSGLIRVGGREFFNSSRRVHVPVHKRGLGMVFQSYAIWPQMTVAKNVAYALHSMKGEKRIKRAAVSDRVEAVLQLVGLDHLKGRSATKLSGGQQQRLALARALAVEPPVLLLDEPLSNLDLKLRESMRVELKRMQRELGITTLYVTHDQIEALAMSNKIAVMNRGRVEQFGSPREIYNRPATAFVSSFIGTTNLIEALVVSKSAGVYTVKSGDGTLCVTASDDFAVDEQVLVSARPEHLAVTALVGEDGHQPSAVNCCEGTIEGREFLGEAAEFRVRTAGGVPLRVRTPAGPVLRAGDRVNVEFKAESLALLPKAYHDNGTS